MYLLFAISLLCFLALIAASVVIAPHVRSSRNSTPRQQTFAEHLQAAASDRDSRHPRTLSPQTVRNVVGKKDWNQSQAQPSEAIGPLAAMRKLPPTSHESPRIQANARNSSRFSKGY